MVIVIFLVALFDLSTEWKKIINYFLFKILEFSIENFHVIRHIQVWEMTLQCTIFNLFFICVATFDWKGWSGLVE